MGNTERASRWEIAMLRRKPTRIELRTEDKQEYEELKKLAAKGASSQSGANETFGKFGVSGLKSLGGFKNVRDVHDWKGLQVEVDETKYPWGTVYELECETNEPERIKGELEVVLRNEGISYEYSKVTKFQNFINKTLE